jgi:enoyl-CoA hydratase/carnithine racemase
MAGRIPMSNGESLKFDLLEGGVAVITLNRPEQLNAMTREMSLELIKLLDRADDDPKVRVVVLTGEGRAFCAGADLSEGASAFTPTHAEDATLDRDWGGVLVLRIFEMLKPTIAAINGVAAGVGATLTLPCDIRIAATGSKIGFVFTRRGIVPDGCATWFLPRVVGISRALQWCLSGALIPTEQALAAGLFLSLHDPADVLPMALEMAREIALNTSSVSVSLTRQLLWHGLVESDPIDAHRLESIIMTYASSSADAREGVESFLGKRPAEFKTRVPNDLPDSWPLWEKSKF